jgi:uncharacterized membrane protein
MPAALLVAVYLLGPALALWLCFRFPVLRKVGVVILCYVLGMALGNAGIIPESLAPLQARVSEVAVALALPLMLFSSDVRRWGATAGRALLAFGLAVVAVALTTGIGYLVLRTGRDDAWQLAGMSLGVYTGGTPNLAAIKTALHVDDSTFVVFNTYDTVVSLAYILLMASVMQRVLLRFLEPYRRVGAAADAEGLETESLAAFGDLLAPRRLPRLALALGASAAIMAAAAGLGLLAPASYRTTVSILVLTSLGIAASLVPAVQRLERTFQLGLYVILVFCVVVGSRARLDALVNVSWPLLGFVGWVIFGSLAVQVALCRLARIDVDTVLVTHVSAICSPPFVPVVTTGLRNQELLPVGITTGIIGYAIGNYLGIGLAWAIRSLGG